MYASSTILNSKYKMLIPVVDFIVNGIVIDIPMNKIPDSLGRGGGSLVFEYKFKISGFKKKELLIFRDIQYKNSDLASHIIYIFSSGHRLVMGLPVARCLPSY